jgi:hypothetical protein
MTSVIKKLELVEQLARSLQNYDTTANSILANESIHDQTHRMFNNYVKSKKKAVATSCRELLPQIPDVIMIVKQQSSGFIGSMMSALKSKRPTSIRLPTTVVGEEKMLITTLSEVIESVRKLVKKHPGIVPFIITSDQVLSALKELHNVQILYKQFIDADMQYTEGLMNLHNQYTEVSDRNTKNTVRDAISNLQNDRDSYHLNMLSRIPEGGSRRSKKKQ